MNSELHAGLDNLVKYLPELPSPKQRQFLRYSCTEGLFGGSAGGGKSSALLMAALQGIMVPNYSALLCRRTYQDLSLSGALMDRSHQWWSKTDAHWSSENKTWTFPSGARISFGYMDDQRSHLRYQGAELQFVGFDETSQFPEEQALYLLSRLRAPHDWPDWLGCRWRGATNPGGIGHEWLQQRYRIPTDGTRNIIEQRINGKVVRAFVPSFAADNPGLNVAEYELKLDLLDPLTRAQLKDGKWIVDSQGLVYYCYSEQSHVESLPKYIRGSEFKRVLGCDWGSTNDKCAFVVCTYSPHEPEVYIEWAEQHSHMSPSDAARRVNELSEQFGGFVSMVGDSGGLGAAYHLELRKHFAIPINPAEKTQKLGYIKLVNGELAAGRLKVIPHMAEPWCQQAKLLLWSDSQKNRENQSQHNDLTDAALYAWRECRHYSAHDRPAESGYDDEGDPDGAAWERHVDAKAKQGKGQQGHWLPTAPQNQWGQGWR